MNKRHAERRDEWKGGKGPQLHLLEAHEGGVGPLVVLAEVEDVDPEVEGTLAHLL
jgi:hypothetical protein